MRTPGEQPPEGGGSGEPGSVGGGGRSGGEGGGPAGESGEPAEAGRVLAGRYRVTGRLGRGGMGMVWRAVDEVLAREVAVKELRTFTDAAGGELAELRTRMEREARAAARVRHAGVVSVHDVAQHEGRPVIVMELIEGPSLDDVLRERGTVEPQEAAAIGAKVMDALAAAHRAGVLHRDVKPGNVLLENGTGRVVLTDFGIAAVEDPDDGAGTQLTRSGELVGSLDYLAPERARGEAPRAACDVWALGATLYAAVEGAAPFRRTSTWSTLNAIVVEPFPEPRRAGPLGPVLAELLEKDPGRRADAERAMTLLEAVADGTAPPDRPSSTMRLGKAAQGQYPQHSPEHGGQGGSGSPPGRVPAPAPETASASAHASASGHGPASGHRSAAVRDTDQHTVRTRGERVGGPRRAVVAAAVAAVVLTGAGASYAVMSGTGGEDARAGGGTTEPGSRQSGNDAGSGQGKHGPPPRGGKSAGSKPGATAGGSTGGKDGGRNEGKGDGGGQGTAGSEGAGTGGAAGGPGGSSGTSAGGSTGGSGGAPGPAPACHPRPGKKKFDCTVWKAAASYNARHEKVGRLNAGNNYFYCQKKLKHRETSGRWTNVWWARTDDDSGNKRVFVSDVYIKGGANDRPVPGLPVC